MSRPFAEAVRSCRRSSRDLSGDAVGSRACAVDESCAPSRVRRATPPHHPRALHNVKATLLPSSCRHRHTRSLPFRYGSDTNPVEESAGLDAGAFRRSTTPARELAARRTNGFSRYAELSSKTQRITPQRHGPRPSIGDSCTIAARHFRRPSVETGCFPWSQRRRRAQTEASQAENAGSIPVIRSNPSVWAKLARTLGICCLSPVTRLVMVGGSLLRSGPGSSPGVPLRTSDGLSR